MIEKLQNSSIINFPAFIKRPVMFHISLWLFVILILSAILSFNGNWPYYFYLSNIVVAVPAMMLFAYPMSSYGNQLLLKHKKPLLFVLALAVMSFSCALLIPLLNHYVFFGIIFPRVFEPENWFNWRLIPQNLILLWFPFFILSIKTFFMNWFQSEQEKLLIENRRLLTEIQLMKIKLHPHFLFNTLNNLYAMSTKKSENTSEYIMKLSEIFRVMLYECNQDFYPLREEVGMIVNYIELERLRYGDRLDLKLKVPETIDDKIMLPPLLFFTFVENAFKHGCSNDVGQPFIEITIELTSEEIVFRSKNSIPETITKKKFGGFGLENTMRRLNIIYEGEYNYQSKLHTDHYLAYLRIPQLISS